MVRFDERESVRSTVVNRTVPAIAHCGIVDLTHPSCGVSVVSLWRELYRKLVPDRNKRLSVQNWKSLSSSSVPWASKPQHPPEEASDTPSFPTCALKWPATAILSRPLLLWNKVAISSLNWSRVPVLQSVWGIGRDDRPVVLNVATLSDTRWPLEFYEVKKTIKQNPV